MSCLEREPVSLSMMNVDLKEKKKGNKSKHPLPNKQQQKSITLNELPKKHTLQI